VQVRLSVKKLHNPALGKMEKKSPAVLVHEAAKAKYRRSEYKI